MVTIRGVGVSCRKIENKFCRTEHEHVRIHPDHSLVARINRCRVATSRAMLVMACGFLLPRARYSGPQKIVEIIACQRVSVQCGRRMFCVAVLA